MTETFDSIKKGLKEALAHAHGEDIGAVVHEVQVPDPDVAAIRARSGLSQREFARSIGVAVGTLQRVGAGAAEAGRTGARAAGSD